MAAPRLYESARAAGKMPLVLVCGPWSSGTSAVAGLLANLGVPTPGPHVRINDPNTPLTYEMEPFRELLQRLASEDTLTRLVSDDAAMRALREFRDDVLRVHGDQGEVFMLKHALAALVLRELGELFELRVVCVIRPLADIERTRLRRKWTPEFGEIGAKVIYKHLFSFFVNSDVPFHFVRYGDLLADPAHIAGKLTAFLGLRVNEEAREPAIRSVRRVPHGSS
jgi:hypothetical protein